MIHKGTYDGTIYHNPANRFCIISVKTADKEVPLEARSTRRYRDHLIRFVATGYELPRTDAVELELDGEWKQGKYGMQLQVEQWREIVPRTKSGVEGYLASGLIKGIGPATAALIVSRFGEDTLDILQKQPERLLEIKGYHGKQTGGDQDLLCGEPDTAGSYGFALPVQDHAENGAQDLSVFRASQCGHLEKESVRTVPDIRIRLFARRCHCSEERW